MAFFELQDAQEITRLIGEIDQALQLVSPASRMAVLVSGLNAEGHPRLQSAFRHLQIFKEPESNTR